MPTRSGGGAVGKILQAAKTPPPGQRLLPKSGRASSARQPAHQRITAAAAQNPQKLQAWAEHNKHPSFEQAVALARAGALPPSRESLIANAAIRAVHPQINQSIRNAPGASISGYNALSAMVGPNLAARIPGTQHAGTKPSLGGSALDAALFLPVLRGPRAVIRGVRAIRAGESTATAARAGAASMHEAGPIRQALGKRKAIRTQVFADKQQQFPKSPSLITAQGQKLLDRASEFLTGKVTPLRDSESRIAQGVGKTLTPMSSRGRVPKQAGKFVRHEVRRIQAAKAQDIRAIRGLDSRAPFSKPGGKQMANFWYAQIPREYRNAEGLTLLRGKLAEERAALVASGGDQGKIADIEQNIVQFTHLIEHPVKVDEHAVDAVHSLMNERQQILVDAGRIAPEDAALRPGLVTRWMLGEDLVRAPGGAAIREPGKGNFYALERDVHQTEGVLRAEQRKLATLEQSATKARSTRVPAAAPTVDLAQLDQRIARLEQKASENPIDATHQYEIARAEKDLVVLRALRREHGTVLQASAVRARPVLQKKIEKQRQVVKEWNDQAVAARQQRDAQGPQLRPVQNRGEAYVGHRPDRVKGARSSLLPGGAATGKARAPQGTTGENRLVLAKAGRVRQTLEVAVEDWQAAQVYQFHNIARVDLAAMGKPITGPFDASRYAVVNPKGHKIPRRWTLDEEKKAVAEGFDPQEILIHDTAEYIDNYVGAGAKAEAIIAKARAAGHLDDLRLVPVDVVQRYYNQFLTSKVTVATPGVVAGANLAGRSVDLLNDAIYTSLIYSNPGYIPANFTQNLIMDFAQQGAYLPLNLMRTVHFYQKAPRRLRDMMLAEIGHGASVSAASDVTSPLKAFGGLVGSIADNPPRMAALLHEMAREGIIPKLRFKLSPSDFKAIEHALTSPEMRPKLNDMSDRAVQAMVDFERAQGMEKAIAKRVLFVWAWMRGGTRYPFRFALDHPFRTALIGYTVAGAPGAPERVQSKIHDTLPNVATGMPPWLAGALEAGNTTINGVKYPKVFPTRQISPVSTPWEVFQAARARPGANTFADFLNPGLASAFHVLSKQSPYGRDLPSYVDAAKQTGQRLLPQAGLVQDLISPPKGGLYPGDSSRLGRLERASRVWPIAIDPVEAEKARILNGMDSALATPEKRYRTDLAEVQKLAKDYYQNGGGKLPVEVSQDLAWRRTLDRAVDKIPKDAAGHRDPRRKAEAAARLFIRRFPSAGPTVKTDLAGSQLPVDFERIYRALRADGTTDYSRFKSDMNQASEDHLRELQHVAVAH